MSHALVGQITGIGFGADEADRHRIVTGEWAESPIGPFVDIMWATPDGTRTLVVADEAIGRFITAVYAFDEVVVDPDLSIGGGSADQSIRGAGLAIDLELGRAIPFPPRPDWVTERIEAPIARRLLGVETFGVSPSGVEELYRAKRLRRVLRATATLDGADLGALAPPQPAVGFGFSEPPPFPSVTDVSPRLHDPSGTLDQLIGEIGRS